MDIKVQKRDGTMEAFDRSKIVSGLTNAGATVQEVEKVVGQIEAWVQGVAGGVVKSVDIRAKVIEMLRTANATVASAFEGYSKK